MEENVNLSKKAKTQNRMGYEPMGRLMLKMGIPMIISMVLQTLYNIVDSAFVSNIPENGEAALNALTLTFPIQMLMVALGAGTGVGMNALLARNLGRGNKVRAAHIWGNSVFLGIVIYVVCALFGMFGVKAYISSQTSNPQVLEMAVNYLRICCVISMGIIFFALFEKVLQATGLSMYSTIAQVSGAVTNIILDPILIYGLLGFPAMGVIGAAYATVIGQIVSALLGLIFHLKFNRDIKNGFGYLKPSMRLIKQVYAIGVPAIIAQALMSVMTYGLNLILVRIDEAMVTAYGLYYKIQQFILFAAFGLRDAITPITAFNFGKGDKKRVASAIKYGILYMLAIMFLGLVFIEIFVDPFSGIFGLSGDTCALCVSAMRIISISFIFAGLNIALQGAFQALNSGIESLVISIFRQLLFVLPVAWGFSCLAIQNASYTWVVWMTFPTAETASALIAAALMIRIYRNKVSKIGG